MTTSYIGVDLHASRLVAHIVAHIVKRSVDGAIERSDISISTEDLITKFVPILTSETYVLVESSSCSFPFIDMVSPYVKKAIAVNPLDFKALYITGKKNDRIDAKKLANRLMQYVQDNESDKDFPIVYVPKYEVRQLRSMMSTYRTLVGQGVTLKNKIRSFFLAKFCTLGYSKILRHKETLMEELGFSAIEKSMVLMLQKQHDLIVENKITLQKQIVDYAMLYFREEILLLISIKGITPFIASALLADIGDISRFKKAKELCSYLRCAPRVDSSNGKTYIGAINKRGRHATFWLLLQVLYHIQTGSPALNDFYKRKTNGKSKGKVRVAMVRKVITAIFYMLKNKEKYRMCDERIYALKLKALGIAA